MKHSSHWLHMGACVIIMLAAFFIPSYLAKRNAVEGVTKEKETSSQVSSLAPEAKKTAVFGNVTITVEPEIGPDGKVMIFAVDLSTHSTELDIDVVKSSSLVLSDGRTLVPKRWEGDPSGGHHRSGKLIFTDPISFRDGPNLHIRDGEKAWKFVWGVSDN